MMVNGKKIQWMDMAFTCILTEINTKDIGAWVVKTEKVNTLLLMEELMKVNGKCKKCMEQVLFFVWINTPILTASSAKGNF